MKQLKRLFTLLLVLNVFVTVYVAWKWHEAAWIIRQKLPHALELSYRSGYLGGKDLPVDAGSLCSRLPVRHADSERIDFILDPGSGLWVRMDLAGEGNCRATVGRD